MSPESIKSFVTYYLRNLLERTRREKSGTKWGIDWVVYNIGLARFGRPLRLPFLREAADGYPKSKSEAEFGIDLSFLSEDGHELVIFVLKDEPLTVRTWVSKNFHNDLVFATTPDLSAQQLKDVTVVRIVLAYNKDEHENGITIFDRFVGSVPTQVGDRATLTFERWNLSELVDQTIRHLLNPSLLPERFFGQLSYICSQAADFTHGSDPWEQQLIPNWKRFVDDVITETGIRAPELLPVALIILHEHSTNNPAQETGWIDLIEWAAIALWAATIRNGEAEYRSVVERFWSTMYVAELERFYTAHIKALSVDRAVDQLAAGTHLGAVYASQVAYWHLARLGTLSLDIARNADNGASNARQRLHRIANWFVALANANEAVLRPVLDLEHIQLFLLFEAFRNANRLNQLAIIIGNMVPRLYMRRATNGALPFLDGGNSLDNVLEQVATNPDASLVNDRSSFFVLALLEMCCAFESSTRNELLPRIHSRLVLGCADVGPPGDRRPLDLLSWLPPTDWWQKVLEGPVRHGEDVAVFQLADTRDITGEALFSRLQRIVDEMRNVDHFQLPTEVPLSVLVLASLRHRSPLPPELWRQSSFPQAAV